MNFLSKKTNKDQGGFQVGYKIFSPNIMTWKYDRAEKYLE